MLLRKPHKTDFLLAISAAVFSCLVCAPSLANGQETRKQYRSVTASFEVKYPADWDVSEQTVDSYEGLAPSDYPRNWKASNNDRQRLVSFASPKIPYGDTFYGVTIMICSTPATLPFIHSTCKERDANLSELYKDRVISRKKFTAGGMTIERIETKSTYTSDFYSYARISYKGRRFFVRGSFTKHLSLDRYAPVFDKMLASFRPIKSSKRMKSSILLR